MEATAPNPERTPRGQGKLLRERLVEAALAMIDEGKAAALSIRAVTKRAGVSPTAFYLHFETRDELIRACLERSFAAFRDALRTATADVEDPRERLLRAGLSYIEFARSHPERYALIFGTLEPLPTTDITGPQGRPVAGGAAFEDLVALVLANLPADDPRREEAETLARGIWSGLHGFVMLRYSRPAVGWPSDREFAARLASAWLGEPAGN